MWKKANAGMESVEYSFLALRSAVGATEACTLYIPHCVLLLLELASYYGRLRERRSLNIDYDSRASMRGLLAFDLCLLDMERVGWQRKAAGSL